jgi:hypothetical protein
MPIEFAEDLGPQPETPPDPETLRWIQEANERALQRAIQQAQAAQQSIQAQVAEATVPIAPSPWPPSPQPGPQLPPSSPGSQPQSSPTVEDESPLPVPKPGGKPRSKPGQTAKPKAPVIPDIVDVLGLLKNAAALGQALALPDLEDKKPFSLRASWDSWFPPSGDPHKDAMRAAEDLINVMDNTDLNIPLRVLMHHEPKRLAITAKHSASPKDALGRLLANFDPDVELPERTEKALKRYFDAATKLSHLRDEEGEKRWRALGLTPTTIGQPQQGSGNGESDLSDPCAGITDPEDLLECQRQALEDTFGIQLSGGNRTDSEDWDTARIRDAWTPERVEEAYSLGAEEREEMALALFEEVFSGTELRLVSGSNPENPEAAAVTSEDGSTISLFLGPQDARIHSRRNILHEFGHVILAQSEVLGGPQMVDEWTSIRNEIWAGNLAQIRFETNEGFETPGALQNPETYAAHRVQNDRGDWVLVGITATELEEERIAEMFLYWVDQALRFTVIAESEDPDIQRHLINQGTAMQIYAYGGQGRLVDVLGRPIDIESQGFLAWIQEVANEQ